MRPTSRKNSSAQKKKKKNTMVATLSILDDFTFHITAAYIEIHHDGQIFRLKHGRRGRRVYSTKKKSMGKLTIHGMKFQHRINNRRNNNWRPGQEVDLYLEFDEAQRFIEFGVGLGAEGYAEI